MALAETGLEHHVLPVGIGILEGRFGIQARFHPVFLELGGVHHLDVLHGGHPGELVVIEYAHVVLVTALGGDEHHTVTGLGAVDGGGSGILQHLDGLDGFGIQVVDVLHLQTVHQDERVRGRVGGGITADTEAGAGARSGGGGEHLHAGELTLQGGTHVGISTVFQGFGLNGSDGTGHVALFLYTVTYHHGFFKEFGVFHQHDAGGNLVGGEGLRGIADAAHLHGGVGTGYGELERTVHVGGSTVGGAHFHDSGSNHRTVGVYDDALDCNLRPARPGGQEHQAQGHSQFFHLVGHSVLDISCNYCFLVQS